MYICSKWFLGVYVVHAHIGFVTTFPELVICVTWEMMVSGLIDGQYEERHRDLVVYSPIHQ